MGTNITHLAHAAMVLAMLRIREAIGETLDHGKSTLYSPCWINGRRYLRQAPSDPPPTKSYIPICQSFAPIIFPDLRALILPSLATETEIKNKLIEACRISTNQYSILKNRKSVMPETVALMEDIGRQMAG
jgi:hypothetical protein